MIRITEIFHSIQGESSHAGRLCVFVRLTGCNLRCRWCDSEYTFTGGEKLSLDDVVARVNAWWVMVVVLGVAFAFGKTGVVVLFGFISFMALREFVSLSYTRRGDHWALAMVFFFFL